MPRSTRQGHTTTSLACDHRYGRTCICTSGQASTLVRIVFLKHGRKRRKEHLAGGITLMYTNTRSITSACGTNHWMFPSWSWLQRFRNGHCKYFCCISEHCLYCQAGFAGAGSRDGRIAVSLKSPEPVAPDPCRTQPHQSAFDRPFLPH